MAAPKTWLPNDQITHGGLNAELRDQLNRMYGPPCMEVRQTAAYAAGVPSGTIALAVGFNSKYYDYSADGSVMLSGSAPWTYATIVVPGTYLIIAQTNFLTSAAGGIQGRYLGAYIDQQPAFGAALPDTARITYNDRPGVDVTSSPIGLDVEIEYQLGTGNTICLGHWQDSGAALNIDPGADRFFWQMHRISD